MLLVLCTCPPEAAERLAALLVEARVAACVNIDAAVRSFYWWQGEVNRDDEALLIIKSHQRKWAELERLLVQEHPYDLPEIIALPVVRGSLSYLRWVEESLCLD